MKARWDLLLADLSALPAPPTIDPPKCKCGTLWFCRWGRHGGRWIATHRKSEHVRCQNGGKVVTADSAEKLLKEIAGL